MRRTIVMFALLAVVPSCGGAAPVPKEANQDPARENDRRAVARLTAEHIQSRRGIGGRQ